jgi:hypothetical protein
LENEVVEMVIVDSIKVTVPAPWELLLVIEHSVMTLALLELIRYSADPPAVLELLVNVDLVTVITDPWSRRMAPPVLAELAVKVQELHRKVHL